MCRALTVYSIMPNLASSTLTCGKEEDGYYVHRMLLSCETRVGSHIVISAAAAAITAAAAAA